MSDQDRKQTAEHYSKQWGAELDFAGFVAADPDAARVMPGRQLPWHELIAAFGTKRWIETYAFTMRPAALAIFCVS